MKKIIKFSGIDCANCCQKLENKLKKIEGIKEIQLSFATSKMLLECEDSDYDKVINDIVEVSKKVEKDAKFLI